jgi:DNA-binding response OmpR family regulator
MEMLEGVRVLVVDDDVDLATSVEDLLTLLGCRVATAHDLGRASDCVEREPPDVVVCDWNLEGERSDRFLRDLKRRRCRVGRVLLTGSPSTEWERLVTERVVQLALSKPVDIGCLASAVASAARCHACCRRKTAYSAGSGAQLATI